MKRNNTFIALLALGWTVLLSQPVFAKNPINSNRAVITVKGMVCDFCAQGIGKKLNKDSRVKSYTIDLEKKTVIVSFKKDQKISKNDLTKIIKQSGYNVRSIRYDKKNN